MGVEQSFIVSTRTVLDKYGAKLRYEHNATTLDANGDATGTTVTNYDIKAVLANYRRQMINGEDIRTGDVQAYISPFAIDPVIGDTMFDSMGKRNSVIDVRRFEIAGKVVMWELQLRH